MSSSGYNLTGNWFGLYDYDIASNTTTFECDLVQDGIEISGKTIEDISGKKLTALIYGIRNERIISFLKLYDIANYEYDDVQYSGFLSQDGQEINGTWTIEGVWEGTFIMARKSSLTVPWAYQRQKTKIQENASVIQ